MKYSFIIPVFNRPDEVDELLDSLTKQSLKDFEVVVVEDGSSVKCDNVVKAYENRPNIKYFLESKFRTGTDAQLRRRPGRG